MYGNELQVRWIREDRKVTLEGIVELVGAVSFTGAWETGQEYQLRVGRRISLRVFGRERGSESHWHSVRCL